MLPIGKQREADEARRQLASNTRSDHFALLRAVRGYEHARRMGGAAAARQFAWRHFLSEQVCQTLAANTAHRHWPR